MPYVHGQVFTGNNGVRYKYVARNSRAEDETYIKSREWECSASPTNAHHWVLQDRTSGGYWKCKHCRRTKPYEMPMYSKMKRVKA